MVICNQKLPNFMNFMSKNSQSGQISRTLIVLAIVLLVLIVALYFGVKFAQNGGFGKKDATPEENTEPKPLYDTTISGIRVFLISSQDWGNFIPASLSKSTTAKDLVTTEKFIRVVIGAQNKGRVNSVSGAWGLGNIVDSEGRNFVPVSTSKARYFLPSDNDCGAIMKPEFEPKTCTVFYEVSKESTNLKVIIKVKGFDGKRYIEYLDLDIK